MQASTNRLYVAIKIVHYIFYWSLSKYLLKNLIKWQCALEKLTMVTRACLHTQKQRSIPAYWICVLRRGRLSQSDICSPLFKGLPKHCLTSSLSPRCSTAWNLTLTPLSLSSSPSSSESPTVSGIRLMALSITYRTKHRNSIHVLISQGFKLPECDITNLHFQQLCQSPICTEAKTKTKVYSGIILIYGDHCSWVATFFLVYGDGISLVESFG